MSLLPASRAHRTVRSAPPRRVLCRQAQRSSMALAVVPVVPHDCPPNRGMHAKRHITPERNLSSRSSGVFASHFAPANMQAVSFFLNARLACYCY